MNGKAILASLLTIGVAATMLGVGTFAYFSDTETSSGNTLQAGTLDLRVNGLDDPLPILVTLADMKPCDWKYATITLHVYDNPADVWIMFKDVVSSEGVDTEPELADPSNGIEEIADYITVDVKIGDTVIIAPEEDVKLSELEDEVIELGEFAASNDYTLTLSFHLQGEVTNWAQGDVATFSIVFGAEQVH